MKAPKTHSTTTSRSPERVNTPFFQQEGQYAFFGGEQVQLAAAPQGTVADVPFFNAADLQARAVSAGPKREADSKANEVVHTSAEPTLSQSHTSTTGQPATTPGSQPTIQRAPLATEEAEQEHPEQEEQLQAKPIAAAAGEGSAAASADLENRLHSTKGGGEPLSEATRYSMESAIGADLSGVNVHTGQPSIQMNQELGAQAFTHGSDIHFNAGKYDPQSKEGQHLLAHELTHVVQQGGGIQHKLIQAKLADYSGLPKNEQCQAFTYKFPVVVTENTILYDGPKQGLSPADYCKPSSQDIGCYPTRPAIKLAVDDELYAEKLVGGGFWYKVCYKPTDRPAEIFYVKKAHAKKPAEPDSTVPDHSSNDDNTDLLAPIDVTWAGDPFRISFGKEEKDSRHFIVFNVAYQGSHAKADIGGAEDGIRILEAEIRPGSVAPKIISQTRSALEVDVHGDRSKVIKLVDKFGFRPEPLSGKNAREHSFSLYVNGRFKMSTITLFILDANATEDNTEKFVPDEVPGENPKSVIDKDGSIKIQIDADGDQRKELQLNISSTDESNGDSKQVYVRVTHISSGHHQIVEFTTALTGMLFPLVKEVTDGKGPTKIALNWPHTTSLLVEPPQLGLSTTGYSITLSLQGQVAQVDFPVSSERIGIASEGTVSVQGNIGTVDIRLGAYEDLFRLTFRTLSMQKALLGITSMSRGKAFTSNGTEVKITPDSDGKVFFGITKSSDVSIGIDLNQDGAPDIEIFDQLTTPDSGGSTESNRNHRLRISGDAVGEDKFFYFQIRNNYPRYYKGSEAVSESVSVVKGLASQDEVGEFKGELSAYERAKWSTRNDAAEKGLIQKTTFDALIPLSADMIILEHRQQNPPSDTAAPKTEESLIARIVENGRKFKNLFEAETSQEYERVVKGSVKYGGRFEYDENIYTGHQRDKSIDFSPVADLPSHSERFINHLIAGEKALALVAYRKLIKGYDRWVANQLKDNHKAGEAERFKAIGLMSDALHNLQGKNPIRVNAVFRPNEKFKTEDGYIEQVPLTLYAYKEDGSWYLKNLTNPQKPYHERLSGFQNQDLPPKDLLLELDNPDYFPEGVIYFNIPGAFGGQIETTNPLTWKKFLSYIGIGLAAVGLGLVTFGSGTVAVVGGYVLAGSALASGASAAANIVDRAEHGDLDATTLVIDLATIVGSIAGVGLLASGKIVLAAQTAANAGRPMAGIAAHIANAAGKAYIPLVGINVASEAISLAAISVQTLERLEEIEKGGGDRGDKNRAKLLLLTQLAVTGGLTILSIKGDLPAIKNRKNIIIDYVDGVPFAHSPESYLTIKTRTEAERLVASLSNRQRGPVVSGVLDSHSGRVFYGTNKPVAIENLHPILRRRLDHLNKRTGGQGNRPSYEGEIPGSHAEIDALNQALHAREKALGRSLSESDLPDFMMRNVGLRGSRKLKSVPPRCDDCKELTEGVTMVGGN